MDTRATQDDHGWWSFTVGDRHWKWIDCMGLNLSTNGEDLLYCKTLDFAVMFAWGFAAGVRAIHA